MYTVEQLKAIIAEARQAAADAANDYFQEKLGGEDKYACGFAWVSLYKLNGEKIKGNTKIGRALKAAGVRQDYDRVYQIWNPSGHMCQNVDTKFEGAKAAAQVFGQYGFEAYAGDRLD
jgi:hypothetical protein